MYGRFAYPVDLKQEMDGTIIVTFPDLSEANTFGTNIYDALNSAVDCLDVSLLGRMKDGTDIPLPSECEEKPKIEPSPAVQRKAEEYLGYPGSLVAEGVSGDEPGSPS